MSRKGKTKRSVLYRLCQKKGPAFDQQWKKSLLFDFGNVFVLDKRDPNLDFDI